MSENATTRTPAYSVTEVFEVLDPAGAQRYSESTPGTVEEFGGRFVVLGAQPTIAEGDAGIVLAVVEWPDMETLEAWYDSEEYAPARQIAATAMRRRLVFLPGLPATI
ncbi:DUF1330 domain-containing protein [Curtobacterium sp. MCSS17_015]|uniref:DUF1330 domain-containing protein n=1 Tax=Curtobacterium sp. MCSS17_015 TaxID=2175666 RepID=UPI0015E89237|nr:DUF1330 domain-containing protein [Curtobacterium sp. MCSS17_015]WIB26849.1 DUF1330 domain-containing protein [Curtobacterium sp. MCSS17_015]